MKEIEIGTRNRSSSGDISENLNVKTCAHAYQAECSERATRVISLLHLLYFAFCVEGSWDSDFLNSLKR